MENGTVVTEVVMEPIPADATWYFAILLLDSWLSWMFWILIAITVNINGPRIENAGKFAFANGMTFASIISVLTLAPMLVKYNPGQPELLIPALFSVLTMTILSIAYFIGMRHRILEIFRFATYRRGTSKHDMWRDTVNRKIKRFAAAIYDDIRCDRTEVCSEMHCDYETAGWKIALYNPIGKPELLLLQGEMRNVHDLLISPLRDTGDAEEDADARFVRFEVRPANDGRGPSV